MSQKKTPHGLTQAALSAPAHIARNRITTRYLGRVRFVPFLRCTGESQRLSGEAGVYISHVLNSRVDAFSLESDKIFYSYLEI